MNRKNTFLFTCTLFGIVLSAGACLDRLDSGEVYLLGTLEEGLCGRDAVVHWSDPNMPLVGFACLLDSQSAVIRPTDKRLLYSYVSEYRIRKFLCDGGPSWTPEDPYPGDVKENDVIIPSPACDPETGWMFKFLVAPTGEIAYRCYRDAYQWYNPLGQRVFDGTEERLALLHLGFNRTAFTGESIVDLDTGESSAVTGLPNRQIYTIRAVAPSGFWFVLQGDPRVPYDQELWKIERDGRAYLIGVYPAPPDLHLVSAWNSKLDGHGNLFQAGTRSDVSFVDVIIRRSLEGTSDVVYSELDDPIVKMHGSQLFTGP